MTDRHDAAPAVDSWWMALAARAMAVGEDTAVAGLGVPARVGTGHNVSAIPVYQARPIAGSSPVCHTRS